MSYKLSPHTLNIYQECSRCFWTHMNEGKERPRGPFPSLPSGMDIVIKKYFDTYRAKGELPPELRELKGTQLFADEEKLKQWRNNRTGLGWTDAQGNELRGSLDDILETEKGKLIVIDFKTRGFPLKQKPHYYQLQLETYTFLLKQQRHQTEDFGCLLFFSPQKIDARGNVLFLKQLSKMQVTPSNAERAFNEALELLNKEKPAINKNCQYCLWTH